MHVAFDGTFDIHVTEARVDVAPHLAAYEDVAESGMHVVLYLSAHLEVAGPCRNVVFYGVGTDNHIADEPLLGRVRRKRQEYDETEDHDGEREQRQDVGPKVGYGGVHTSLACRRETARYTAAMARSTKASTTKTARCAEESIMAAVVVSRSTTASPTHISRALVDRVGSAIATPRQTERVSS